MRWKNAVAGLALTVAGIVGCKQTCFLTECDYNHYKDNVLPTMPSLECDSSAAIRPTTSTMPTPSNVEDPDRKLRFLTLKEAFAMALENGTTGPQGLPNSPTHFTQD